MIGPKKKRRLRIVAAVDWLHTAADQTIKTGIAVYEANQEHRIQCKRGCNACCRMAIAVTMPEAVAIVSKFPDVVREVTSTLEAHADRIVDITMQHAPEVLRAGGTKLSREQNASICDAWWREQLACAFLGADGDCRIYEARPLACRAYLVVSESSKCAEVPATTIGQFCIEDLEHDGTQALVELANAANLTTACGPLPTFVLHAQQQQKAEP